MLFESKNIYSCKVWSSSYSSKQLTFWKLLLPLSISCTGLPTKINRFTLLRSPLGNKKSKDQFERREYRSFFLFESKEPHKVLALLDALKYLSGIKLKILVEIKPKI